MFKPNWVFAACCALVAGLAVSSSMSASTEANRAMFVTVNRPVGLPGVALGSGTYIFELANPQTSGGWNAVRVLSRDRKLVHYHGFTRVVVRPHDMPLDQVLSFEEARPDVPQPIRAWYPKGDSVGRQFIYPDQP